VVFIVVLVLVVLVVVLVILTGHGHVAVGFSLVDDVHHFIRTGNKPLRAALTGSAQSTEVLILQYTHSAVVLCSTTVVLCSTEYYLHIGNLVLVLVDRQVGLGH